MWTPLWSDAYVVATLVLISEQEWPFRRFYFLYLYVHLHLSASSLAFLERSVGVAVLLHSPPPSQPQQQQQQAAPDLSGRLLASQPLPVPLCSGLLVPQGSAGEAAGSCEAGRGVVVHFEVSGCEVPEHYSPEYCRARTWSVLSECQV